MQMTYKDFRHLAQGTQSIVMAAAVIAALGMAWYALKVFQRAQETKVETAAG